MAILIPADGSEPRYIAPANGRSFAIEELQTLVAGFIECLAMPWSIDRDAPLVLFLNEDGKRLQLPVNRVATTMMLATLRAGDVIVGDVVVCTRVEAGEDNKP
jgi:hypothetical protein